MSKRIVTRAALLGLYAAVIGLAGCTNNKPVDAGPPKGAPAPVPNTVLDHIKQMPPEQQQAILRQMKDSPQGQQIGQAIQGGSTSSGSSAPSASGSPNGK